MLSEKVTEDVFKKIYAQNENDICFECNMKGPKWASVTNGILICLNCSGKHRALGVTVSFVRSNNMDSWNERQLNMMLMGGNQRLREFFETYCIPQSAPLDFKYKTKAAIYYREMLAALVDEKDVGEAPSLEEGLKLVDFSNPNFNSSQTSQGISNTGFGSKQLKEEQKRDDDPMDSVKNFFVSAFNKTAEASKNAYDKTVEGTKKAQQTIKSKINDPELKEDMNKFKSNVSKKTDEIGNKAKEGMEKFKSGIIGMWDQFSGKQKKNEEKQQEYREYFESDSDQIQAAQKQDDKNHSESTHKIIQNNTDDLLDFNDDNQYKQ